MVVKSPFIAVAGIFLAEAIAFTSWLPRLPEIKSAIGLNQAELGLVLAAMPAGALIAMPIAGALSMQLDLRRLNLAFMLGLIGAMLLLAFASSTLWLALALFCVGLGTGAMGVVMNAAGIAAEKELGRPILARCHALFSVGVTIGGSIGSLAASYAITIPVQTAMVGVALVALLLLLQAGLPRERPERSGEPRFALPTGALLVPAIVAFVCLMSEGAILDWSSIYLAHRFDATTLVGGGVVGFGVAMATARFVGDWLYNRYGGGRIITTGAGLAACGFVVTALAPQPAIAIAGFALSGLGLAGIIPITFRRVSATSGMAPGAAVAAVSSIGYTGFLTGPPLMGFLGQVVSLSGAFAVLAAAMVLVAALSSMWLTNAPADQTADAK